MRLRVTQPALTDLDDILNYIAAQSPRGAKGIHERIKTIFDLLLAYPLVGTPTDDPAIRRITTTPFPTSFSMRSRVPM